jgi:shikimate kinase
MGIPGSGKTTLARWTSKTFDVPAHDLDFVVYDFEAGQRPVGEIVSLLDQIRAREGWVTEGAYHHDWLHPLLRDANVIVWLDVPLATCFARIIKRHVKAELTRNNPHPGWRKLARFLNYTRRTAAAQRAGTIKLLRECDKKLVRCRSSRDVRAFQDRTSV